ncbi:hypothetical protein JKF63_05986 [Porcisia hertigi]|uniref:Uncharacterized protein n=1 Tax=Porcisia hertigi TaxID=2761500 RepID=A0A836LIC1_9TRYP|nr:hypothetical protein JKF63_05986 [Porcisia hertigi]
MSTIAVTAASPTTAVVSATPPPRTHASQELHLSEPAQSEQRQLLLRSRLEEGVTYKNDDDNGTVHYQFYLPHASSVAIAPVKVGLVDRGDGAVPVASIGTPVCMTKHQDGMWATSTSAPVGLQCVVLMVDGHSVLTPHLSIGCLHGFQRANYIDVPPPNPKLCIYAIRPCTEHGTVAHNYVTSYTMETTEEVLIYAPPSYHKAGSATRRYPVLYLLHDNSENEMNAIRQGKVNVIADNLIADGKITEMIIVMKSSVSPRIDGACLLPCDVARLCKDLTDDIIPYIDSHYRTEADCHNRAIAGVSLASMLAIRLCITRYDLFAYGGIFSGLPHTGWSFTGTNSDYMDTLRRDPAAFQAAMKVLFRGISDDDTHTAIFEADDVLLAELGVACERRIYACSHSWQMWRQAAVDFLPMLFKGLNSPPRH